MKHFRKVSAVLLAVLMMAVMLPSFINISVPIEAAEAGVVSNGGFELGDATDWSPSAYGVTITNSSSYRRSGSYGCRLSKDSSHNGNGFLTQVVPVNTNATYTFSFYVKSVQTDCDYVACFTYSLSLGTAAGNCNTSVVSQATVNPGGTSWTQITYSVSTGSNKYLKIQFIGTGVGSGDCGLDDIALTATNPGDTGTHAAPSLTGFATDKNWPNGAGSNANDPAACNNNIIKQPGFEATTNAQWNTSNFLKQGVSVVTDVTKAHSGSKYLRYYHGSVNYTDWPMFEITLPSAGEYVFSAWVRTPNMSANNVGKASIGVIDRDTNKFLTYAGSYYGHYSTPEIQLRSTATDDEWHLRSVTFYVGAANSNVKIGMYGLKSEMYVDDISVHLLTSGVTYSGNQKGALSVSSTNVTNKYCDSANNLIADCNMNSDLSKDFWTKAASGWNNGFLNFQADAQSTDHGNTLHYKGTNPGSNKLHSYIKFVYVEPNTSYTVSFDYRVSTAGNQLMFIDNNIERPAVFHTPSLGSASNSWKTYAFTFNTGNYNRIGIVFKDHASAEIYFDDFRFFKTSDGIANEPVEELFPDLKPEHTGKSRMEMTDRNTLGLAFRFNLECEGVTLSSSHVANYANGTIKPFNGDSTTYKLVSAGAVMTNDASVGQDETLFRRDKTTANKTVIDIPAEKLFNVYHKDYYDDPETGIVYAVRITNIPESHMTTVIYARPYYVFEDANGKQFTAYGDVEYDSYKPLKDINDGWLEWD